MITEKILDEYGARNSRVDLSLPFEKAEFEQIVDAVNRYSFLLFQNQQMNDAAPAFCIADAGTMRRSIPGACQGCAHVLVM